MEQESYSNDFFYNPYGLKLWQLRHMRVSEILNE